MALSLVIVPKPVHAVTLTNSDPAALEQAVAAGGTVTLAFDGTVALTNTLVVVTNTTVDGTGHAVSLDGGNLVRHFMLTNAATLRLVNLTLANGHFAGAGGETNQNGSPGAGGSIYNAGGTLELLGCNFLSNNIAGGLGGALAPTNFIAFTYGGTAYGGAIYSSNGVLRATGCLFAGNSAIGGNGQSIGGYTAPGNDSFGGAIYSTNMAAALIGVTFTSNVAQAGWPSGGRTFWGGGQGAGGAFANDGGNITISNCTFGGNQCLGTVRVVTLNDTSGMSRGGALFHQGGSMSLVETLFISNVASGGPGGARSSQPVESGPGIGGAVCHQSGSVAIRSCTFAFNEAIGGVGTPVPWTNAKAGTGLGGAIWSIALLEAVNCTFSQNQALGGNGVWGIPTAFAGPGYGGAVFADGGTASFVNVTVSDNLAQSRIVAIPDPPMSPPRPPRTKTATETAFMWQQTRQSW